MYTSQNPNIPNLLDKKKAQANFLQYSDKDFSSYMEYLVNNRNDFYDTNYLARLEHQVKMLKRLINLQVT